jgi:DNA-binding response OmpR family regulator
VVKPPHFPTNGAPDHTTIVVVDPEPLYRWFATESLGGGDVDVLASASLEDAEACLRASGSLDLLIVDGGLLHGDARRLCRLRERARVGVLVLDPDGDLSGHGLGDVTVAAKPVDSAALVSLVARQLRRSVPAA